MWNNLEIHVVFYRVKNKNIFWSEYGLKLAPNWGQYKKPDGNTIEEYSFESQFKIYNWHRISNDSWRINEYISPTEDYDIIRETKWGSSPYVVSVSSLLKTFT